METQNIDTIIAIDPGYSGSIVKYRNGITETINMPREIHELNRYFAYIRSISIQPICFIEKVQLFDSDNNKGKQFRIQIMLQQYEQLKSILVVNNIPFVEVAPITWQSKLHLRIKGEDKDDRKRRYRDISQIQNPGLKVTLKSGDALQILRFGRGMLQNDVKWIMDNLTENNQLL